MIALFAALIGACMGSFGNVLVDRLPSGESLLGRSRCDGCRRVLSPLELVPVFSWAFLRARCRSCGARIPVRVPLVEAFSAVLAAAAFLHAPEEPLRAVSLFLALWALLLIAVVDLRTRTIPDALTLTAFFAAVLYQWSAHGAVPVLAPSIGAAFFAVQWLVSRGRWVGSGDVFLAAAVGMLAGTPEGAVWMILVAYGVGASVAIVLLAFRKLSRGDSVPFGPFLVFAGYAVFLLGSDLPPLPGAV